MDQHAHERAGRVVTWAQQGTALLVRHERGLAHIEAAGPDILRVRFAPSGELSPPRAWDTVLEQPPAQLEIVDAGSALTLGIADLTASLDLQSGALAFTSRDGVAFGEDIRGPQWREMSIRETALDQGPELELPPGAARTGCFLHKRMAPNEGYFGFGQRTGKLNRRYRRLTNWTVDRSSPGHSRGDDNMYQAHPVFLALRPSLCWGLYLHSSWYSGFDVGAEREDTLALFTLGGELDYFVFAGPTPAAVVEQLTRLTGRPALPPLWAMGYHQSRWSYASDADVRGVAHGFRSRQIPLDAIHIDIDYMDGFRVFTWGRERFPDPQGTVAALHAEQVRAVTIVDPGVKKDLSGGYAVADEGLAGRHFVHGPDGEPFSGWVWPGESLFPDFCRDATRSWWGEHHAALTELGVDGIWCDMNEPAIVDRPFSERGANDHPIPLASRHGEAGEALHTETHNLYGHLMARATNEGLARLRPERRPWVLTRSGFVGTQRWAASWMGDNSAWWEHLEMSLPQLASMGLCGSPHVGVDIGGFYDNSSPELFARWFELGTFYPFMRGHKNCSTRVHEPWALGPEVEAIARAAIERRYRLLPYLYTLAHRAHRSGEPIWRPLFYDFPDTPELHQIEDQVMIGPQLMIAPVYQPGVRRRLIELPPGTWYDFHTGAEVTGSHGERAWIADAPLGTIPILVRGGSILPLGNVRQSTAESLAELTLEVYPDPDAGGRWTLIEDEGEGFGYRDGRLAETDFELERLTPGHLLRISARRGGYDPPPRTLILRLHLAAAPTQVRLDGTTARDWHWDTTHQAIELRLEDDGNPHRLETMAC